MLHTQPPPFLNRTGARAVIVVTLRIPSTVRNGQVNALTLEAQPEYADTVDERSLTRRFYFTANGDVEGGDSEPPECNVSYPTEASEASEGATAAQLCDGFMGQMCANKMWAANVQFQVRGSFSANHASFNVKVNIYRRNGMSMTGKRQSVDWLIN